MALPILSADIIDGIKTEKNYIRGQVEKNTASWTNFKNSVVGIAPESGAGTTADSDVTWSLTTTNPISGASSFQLVKPAANRQGNSKRYQFTIDRGDRYSVIRIAGKSEVVSGTFTYGDGTTVSPSSVRWYIRDVTNDVIIEPTGTMMDGSGNFFSEYQTTDSLVYELILHIADATSNAWTINFDLFSVGPRTIARGPILSDPFSFTPSDVSYSWGTVSASSFNCARNGKFAIIEGYLTLSSAVSAEITLDPAEYLPPGLTADTSAILTQVPCGSWFSDDASAATNADNAAGVAIIVGATGQILFVMGNPTEDVVDGAQPQTWASGDTFSFKVMVPVLGWGSNTVLSSDSGTRALVLNASRSATQSIPTGVETDVIFDNVEQQTGGISLNTSTGIATVSESGWYFAHASARFDNLNDGVEVYGTLEFDGVGQADCWQTCGGASLEVSLPCVAARYLNAGGTISYAVFQSTGVAKNIAAGSNTTLSIFKIQSPQTIATAEKCKAIYESNSGQSITVAVVVINFEDKETDTHNAVTVGAAWKWTAPQAGFARVNASIYFQNITTASGDVVGLAVRKNGSNWRQAFYEITAATTLSSSFNIDALIPVAAGDTIDLTGEFAGGPESLNATSTRNWISISLE